ncbi:MULTISPECIES: cytochrome P450 [unclassified Streptomyces]|uniref:cytochrome P450 family protein n=1 Tax=unclassified Streptomyces TaxID=2593676 RepID=UPI002DDC2ACA|nr:cytochrome P450 [Streptomyces sp. NBC_01750]WSB04737.1 cytochrome P450 [Streptomyces sp. NBC_01794]WSD30983.1 cytochrome P450 [Streptomyces sp. NBC_01750]
MGLTQCPLFSLDPDADPAEEARQLHAQGSLVPVELPGGVAAWAATDLATAQRVFGDERLTKDPAHWPALADGRIPDDWELIALVRGAGMVHSGRDDHRRLRQLVSAAFTRAPVEALRPRIAEIADELLDSLGTVGPGEPVDLREHFAYPLPVRVICEVLGVPNTAITELRHRFDRLVTPQVAPSGEADIRVAVADIHRSLTALIEIKREDPGDDLTTALIQARDDGDRLTDQELVETLFLILIAGHETTINSITNTAYALLQNPKMLAALRDTDAEAPTWVDAVEEGLRFFSPIRHALMRYATQGTDIAGVRVAKGDPVIASLVAVGRDPRRHENPDDFDVTRPTRRDHVAFGHGAHYCLGARLAKLETEIALRALFTRYPGLTLAAEPERLASIPLQGLRALRAYLHAGEQPPPAAQ